MTKKFILGLFVCLWMLIGTYVWAQECTENSQCQEGYVCLEELCVLEDPPTIELGPFLAAGPWPVLPTDLTSPMVLGEDYSVLWTFSDDEASCEGQCTYVAEYQAVGDTGWTELDVDADLIGDWHAGFELPIATTLQNATTYALRFAVTDCIPQSTQSELYYFRVAKEDNPPVLEAGPFLAAGPWPRFKRNPETAFTLSENYDVVWTFSDDYASCEDGPCTHRFKFRKVGEETWTRLTPIEAQSGELTYAYLELPITSLETGTYQFNYTVLDCIGQKDLENLHYFKVEAKQPEPAFTETALYSTTMPQNNDETDIYYPVPDENDSASYTFPVALFLQGGKVNKSYFSEFANKLAAYGFIVVVPNHYADFTLTDPDYPGIEIDFVGFFPENQQIPDVLDFMSAENTNAASPLYGIVNSEIMALTGHSFGSAVTIDAIQQTCEFPLCRPQDSTFTLPEEVKAVALTGINTIPFGNPFDTVNRPTNNPVPMAIINGDLDENAEYHDTKESYTLIENPPKSLVFVKGANHYGLCDENNPGNPNYPAEPQNDGTPTPQENPPTLDQDISIETTARWAALFLRAHALNDPAAMNYISTTGKLLDPNVEVRYGNEQLDYEVLLTQASEIDENICEYTQTLFGDIDETSGITVDAVNPGSAFTSTKATVDNSTNTAIPVFMIVQGTSDEIFRNDKINTMIWCKTRIPEAIKWNTGIDYTEQDAAAGTCRQVNEYVYDMTLDILTDEQREKYNNEGKPIIFTDETIVGQGIDFYALDQYSLITDMGTHLSISPASLESDFIDFSDDRHGAKYCKIISSQNLLAWMQDGAFNNGASLTPADNLDEITCEDMENSTGSCYFANEHTGAYFCEDYLGPNYTGGDSGTAKAKCIDSRGGTYVDAVPCADRTDTTGLLTGICAINESADGAYTWTLYYPDGEAECPLRFFTCNE